MISYTWSDIKYSGEFIEYYYFQYLIINLLFTYVSISVDFLLSHLPFNCSCKVQTFSSFNFQHGKCLFRCICSLVPHFWQVILSSAGLWVLIKFCNLDPVPGCSTSFSDNTN